MRISVGICRAAQFARVSALCVPGRKRAGIGVPKMSRRTNQGIPQGGQPPPYRQVARCHTLLRSHYSILSVVCQRVCRKVFGFFCFSLWRLYRMHNAWLGFCASQPSRTCDKAGSPWAVLGETARQIDSAVPFFCFHLFLFVLLRIFAQLAIVTILLLTPTRISGCRRFYVLCGIRYPFTRMFDQRCLPRKLLFCFCRISGVPETVVPFPPGQRDR